MRQAVVTINNVRGFHATPAAMFAQTAMKFYSKITVSFNGRKVNAKNLVHVVALGAKTGDILAIEANGMDEEKAISALVDLVENRNFDGE